MCRHFHLDLDALPWPVSLLKFNQAVDTLRAGETLSANLCDADIVGNLERLMTCQPTLDFEVVRTERGFHVRVARR